MASPMLALSPHLLLTSPSLAYPFSTWEDRCLPFSKFTLTHLFPSLYFYGSPTLLCHAIFSHHCHHGNSDTENCCETYWILGRYLVILPWKARCFPYRLLFSHGARFRSSHFHQLWQSGFQSLLALIMDFCYDDTTCNHFLFSRCGSIWQPDAAMIFISWIFLCQT